jgi:hypothetical protein
METSSRNLSPAMKENNNGYPQSLNPKTEVVNESSDNEYSL